MTRALLIGLVGLTLAGCGDSRGSRAAEPRLPAALAADLATYAEDIADAAAAGDPCAAREQALTLQQETVEAINAGRVPPALQEPLGTAVNNLVHRLVCPPPPAQTTTAQEPDENDGKAKEKSRGKGKGKGKGKGHKK
jgi:hypothetical protein